MGIIKKVFKKRKSKFLRENPKYQQFDIGVWSYGWPSVRFDECGGKLKIGNYCSIAKGTVIMLGGEHDLSRGTTFPFDLYCSECREGGQDPMLGMTKGDVVIGSDVWICHGAFIGSGVTIGHGAVVAAMAIVTKDVEPFSIVGGNPARHIKYRFDEETRARLIKLAWWDWPHEKVLKAWPHLKNFNIDELENVKNGS